MAEEFIRYDTVDYLETEEDMHLYLEACQEEGDPTLITAALGDIARAKNMTQLAQQTGMTRVSLYKALSPEGNPSFDTITKIAKALGFKITIQPT